MLNKLKLNHELKTFCRNFGIKRVKLADSFAYCPEKSEITYSLYMTNIDVEFMDLIKNKYGVNIHAYYFIFSLLHEIGHHMTLDQLSEEDLENDLLLRGVMQFLDNPNPAYINLTAEDLATRWAIDFVYYNRRYCKRLQAKWVELMPR